MQSDYILCSPVTEAVGRMSCLCEIRFIADINDRTNSLLLSIGHSSQIKDVCKGKDQIAFWLVKVAVFTEAVMR